MIIFHGSNIAIEKPEILTCSYNKDFGFGFYCTSIEKQAQRWAQNKRPEHVVSVFDFSPCDEIKTLFFEKMTEEWLNFVVACRRGQAHDYDIVEGPMADDTIWDYVEDLAAERISREAFWVLAKFKYPTYQITFCTLKALSCIKFVKSYSL